MSISIKKNPEYKLKLPTFICDYILKEDVPKPFNFLVSGFKFIVITGSSGSGKTSLLVSMLLDKNILKKTYNNVIVVIPESSRRSMKKDPFRDLDPSKVFDTLEEIKKIYEMVSFYSSEGETSLIIIDDQQSYLKDNSISTILNHIIANRRHLKTTVICLLQTYNLLPLKSRKLINTLITFRPSKKEWKSISEEAIEFNEDISNKIFKLVFPHEEKDKHRWMLIDVGTQRIFSGFDEIIIDD